MNKQQAIADFKENVLPHVIERFGKDDKPAISEAWNDYTDMLCKDRQITQKQYSNWSNPF